MPHLVCSPEFQLQVTPSWAVEAFDRIFGMQVAHLELCPVARLILLSYGEPFKIKRWGRKAAFFRQIKKDGTSYIADEQRVAKVFHFHVFRDSRGFDLLSYKDSEYQHH